MSEYDKYEQRSLLFHTKCETCGENINDQGLLPKRDYIEYHKLFCGQKKEDSK